MKKLLAVDGNSILNRAYYGIRPLTTASGLFTHAVYGFATILHRQIEACKPDALAVAFDLKAPTFRHKQYDGYKATRKGMPEELAVQLPYAKKCAEYMGARVITLEGWEADDILGTLAHMAHESDGWQALVLTGDRDSLQLIAENATILLATNADTITFDRDRFTADYGIPPERFVDVKALMGDSSDNIPGVPGIGEKTALKLISEFVSLDGIYANLASSSIAKGVRTKLETGKDSAYMSQALAAIDLHAPLGLTLGDIPDFAYQKDQLLGLFSELEFSGLIKRLGLDSIGREKASGQSTASPACDNTVLASIGELSAKLGGAKTALLYDKGRLQAACGETAFFECEATPDEVCGLVDRLSRTIVYDSKQLYAQLPALAEDFLFTFDTMLAAYVLDPSEGSYTPDRLKLKYLGESGSGMNAAELFRLAEAMDRIIAERSQESLLRDIEQPLAKVLWRMERDGFKVDTSGLRAFSAQLGTQADALRDRIWQQAGTEFNINSPKQLGEVLFDRLGLPAGKKTKNGYSTGAEILEKLAPYAPIVGDILEYRQLTKLKSTYGDGLVAAADESGRIHSSFNQTITATGRLSSTEPNLQNIPVRTELGREMRRYFIPGDAGRVLIDADYSQIELRLLADISGDETMIDAFERGIDIHAVTASQAFNVPLESVTPEMRKRAKAVNFGIVYGIGDFSLSQDIGVTKKQAAEYIDAYLTKYPKVAQYLKDVVVKAREDGYVTTMFGRRRYIPELTSGKKMLQAFGERVAMNSPIQGTAADIIKVAMINTDRALRESGLDAKLLLQVHDELIVDAAKSDVEAAKRLLIREMEGAVKLKVPLTVSTATGTCWYDCKD